MRSGPKARPWLRSALRPLLLAVAGCLCAPAALAEEPSPQSVTPEHTTPPPDPPRPVLDNRARRLAKMLQLTDAQQADLAKVLASQREQVRKLWSEQRVPPEYRVSQMRAINDKTEDRIRALLNDEQRKKYISSRPRETPSTSQESNLDYWLNATKHK